MANDSKIVIDADVSGVVDGANRATSALESMAHATERAGQRGRNGFNQFVSSADNASRRIERASQSLERSIGRDIATLQAGSRASREYYETIAAQRGLNAARFEPLLKQLDELNNRTRTNTISIGQYNAALRTMPAQMTDVVTQLAGGQNPFLILLQQGGQLRDSFGGFGMMFRGLASMFSVGRVAAMGFVSSLGAVAAAIYSGSQESRAYENALTLAGDRAGITAGQLQDLAGSIGETTQNYGTAREAVLAFAEQGNIAAADYESFATAVTLQSQATGKDVADLVAEFNKIGDDPVKAVVELSGKYRSMTADVYAQVTALIEQGKEQEAVRLVQQKYADETTEMSQRVVDNLGWIEKTWKNIKDTAASAWEQMKNIGRDSTLTDQIFELNQKIQDLRNHNDPILDRSDVAPFADDSVRQREIAKLVAKRDELNNKLHQQVDEVSKKAEQAQIQKDGTAALDNLRRGAEAALSPIERLRKELKQVDDNLVKVRKTGNAKAISLAEESAKAQKADINSKIKAEQERERKHEYKHTSIDSLNSNQKKLYALAKKYGEDPAKWLAMYEIESASGRNLYNSRSGATGHFQIMPAFFKDYGVDRNSAMDLEKSFLAVRRHHAIHSAKLRARLGHELTAGEYYLGQQQGWGGAAALLFNPDKNVVDALATIMSRGKAQAAVSQNGGKLNMTARQFASIWIQKANKLQAKYAGKGIGSLDSGSADWLNEYNNANPYDKWAQNFERSQKKAKLKKQLSGGDEYKIIDSQLELLSNPDYASFSDEQKKIAQAKAKAADEAASRQKLDAITKEQLDALQKKQDLIGKTTEVQRLQYELEKGNLAYLLPETKKQLLAKAQQIEAAEKQYKTDKKYSNLIDELAKKTNQNYTDKMFEISLLGKNKEEIEKLTLAREYDAQIVQAIAEGASTEYIDGLRQQKEAAENVRVELERMQRQSKENYDRDWLNGINDGIENYMTSFKGLHTNIENFIENSMDRMGDSLAEFVATGKGSFRDFTVSILQDLSRMIAKIAIFNALKSVGGYMSTSKIGILSSIGNALIQKKYEGGYTGAGGKYEPAGIVHKGEVVFSQADVARFGGVQAVETARLRGYADGGVVGGGVVGITPQLAATMRPATPIQQIAITVNVNGNNNKQETQVAAQQGVEAAIPKLVNALVKANLSSEMRPGGLIYKFLKG